MPLPQAHSHGLVANNSYKYLPMWDNRATFAVEIEKIVSYTLERIRMNEKVGTLAGAVWTALNENGTMTSKDLKKAAKIKTDKDLCLALGWLLREDKVTVTEEDKSMTITLN